jgi:hypothetical protein
LTNFDIIDHFKDNTHFGGVFGRDNLPKTKNKTFYIVNLNKSDEPGSHWVLIFNNIYFDSFGVSPPEEIIRFMKKPIISSEYRIQAINSIMCGYFCIYVAEELLKGKKIYNILLEFDPLNFNLNNLIIKNIWRRHTV